jgi:hypothetical protein
VELNRSQKQEYSQLLKAGVIKCAGSLSNIAICFDIKQRCLTVSGMLFSVGRAARA